jgi:choline monooxygenase
MVLPENAFNVEPDIARAWTIPSAIYTDPAVLAAENDKIFSRTWQIVGHSHQVTNPGDFFTTELAGEPLVFVRGVDGKHAFHWMYASAMRED